MVYSFRPAVALFRFILPVLTIATGLLFLGLEVGMAAPAIPPSPSAPAPSPTVTPGPAIGRSRLVLEKTEQDAGEVTRGEDATYTFSIRNGGDMPLEIVATPACGCTVADYDHVILPGATGALHATVHTESYHGPIQKVIDLTTNDPDHLKATLTLLARVLSAVEVVPDDTPLLRLKDAGPTVLEVQLQSRAKQPVRVLKATSSATFATADLQPLPDPAGGGHAYKMTLTVGPDAPIGRSVIVVTATTDSPLEPEVTITAVCDKGIMIVPPSIYLGVIDPKVQLPVIQLVSLVKRGGSFHITKIQSDDPHLKVQQISSTANSEYALAVSYTGGWPVGSNRHTFTIHTDDPKQPRLELVVIGTVVK